MIFVFHVYIVPKHFSYWYYKKKKRSEYQIFIRIKCSISKSFQKKKYRNIIFVSIHVQKKLKIRCTIEKSISGDRLSILYHHFSSIKLIVRVFDHVATCNFNIYNKHRKQNEGCGRCNKAVVIIVIILRSTIRFSFSLQDGGAGCFRVF